MYTSANMGLKIWNLTTDLFDYTQLEGNFAALDVHNHTFGQGVQIPTGGIVNGAVTTAKIAAGAVTDATIAPGAITSDRLAVSARRMSWTNPGVSYNAQPGDMVLGTASTTITLPSASGNTDAMIGVMAANGTSGAAPLLVTGASAIKASGLAPTGTSFFLNNPFAYAVVQSDGTAWRLIAGQADSGWVPVTGAASVTSAASVRLLGDQVYLTGILTNHTGGPIAGGTTWATLTSGFRPVLGKQILLWRASTSAALWGTIGTNGTIALVGTSIPDGEVIEFAESNFTVS